MKSFFLLPHWAKMIKKWDEKCNVLFWEDRHFLACFSQWVAVAQQTVILVGKLAKQTGAQESCQAKSGRLPGCRNRKAEGLQADYQAAFPVCLETLSATLMCPCRAFWFCKTTFPKSEALSERFLPVPYVPRDDCSAREKSHSCFSVWTLVLVLQQRNKTMCYVAVSIS